MGRYADQFAADVANAMDDLDDFKTVLVASDGQRWVGVRDTVMVEPSLAIDGVMAGYAFSVWLNLADKPSSVSEPQAHTLATVDSVSYEVANTYKPDNWTMRVDLRTVN